MTGNLNFKLPEENEEFQNAQNGGSYRSALRELDEWLRGQVKYSSDSYTEKEIELLNRVRDELRSHLDELPL